MKLLNQSITLISIFILIIIGVWGLVFYYNVIGEIKESVDEGLNNYKRQIIFQAHQDTVLLKRIDFDEGFYAIQKISAEQAFATKDTYKDTLIAIHKRNDNIKEFEPFRMLITAFEDDDNYYELRVINSMVEKDDLINHLFRNMIILYVLLIVSIIVINNYVLRRVWQPFYRFLTQLKRYQIGSTTHFPSVKTKTKEFIDLQKATHDLLQHNLTSFEQQKEFIGNAAHELQTPLAIALNKLELLIEKEGMTSTQINEIVEVMNLINRLTRLNKSLLLLTKIENKQFVAFHKVDINHVVKKGIKELEQIAAYKKIRFSFDNEQSLWIKMNSSLSEVLVFNLLRNAVFHSPQKSVVDVELSFGVLKIINPGQQALNEETIFHRFQKVTQNNQHQSGLGLGLSIVKAICEVYDFRVNYYFKDKNHHFEITFIK